MFDVVLSTVIWGFHAVCVRHPRLMQGRAAHMTDDLWAERSHSQEGVVKTSKLQNNIILVGIVVLGFYMIAPKTSTAPVNDFTGSSTCDRLAKQQVKNPSSYQSSSEVDAKRIGNLNIFRRNFTAMNGFGGTIDHWYLCEYDTTTKMARLIEINQGNYR